MNDCPCEDYVALLTAVRKILDIAEGAKKTDKRMDKIRKLAREGLGVKE